MFHPLREGGDEFVSVSLAPGDGKPGPEGISSVCCTAAPVIPIRGRHNSFLLHRTCIHPSLAGPGELRQSPHGPVWVSPSVKRASPHRQDQGKSPRNITFEDTRWINLKAGQVSGERLANVTGQLSWVTRGGLC